MSTGRPLPLACASPIHLYLSSVLQSNIYSIIQSFCNYPSIKSRTMDPNTWTREEFTTGLTGVPLPPVTLAPEWKELAEQLRTLLEKLAYHPAMAPNLQQTYMTPAASKNNVYFMWDFVGRTLVSRITSALDALQGRHDSADSQL